MKSKSNLTLVYSRQASVPSSTTSKIVGGLHPAIQHLITRHQLCLAPVCTHSRYASLKPLCEATTDFDVIESAAVPNCNWVVQIGPSLIVVEINLEIGRESLALLTADEPEGWSSTLQFGDDISRFLFFRRPDQRLRFIGNRFSGLRLHNKNSGLLQIPPSWFVAGGPLKWVDPDTAILAAPQWLLEDQQDAA
jgi:hypothetical protein